MKRSKSLFFKSWELFCYWYSTMKLRFQQLTLSYIKHFYSSHHVKVIITY
jgi:hypothetical protein